MHRSCAALLVDKALDLSFWLSHLDSLLDNIKKASFSFAERFSQGKSLVSFRSIVGLDIVQYFGTLAFRILFWGFFSPFRRDVFPSEGWNHYTLLTNRRLVKIILPFCSVLDRLPR